MRGKEKGYRKVDQGAARFDKQLKMKEISVTSEGLLNATMTSTVVESKYPIHDQ